MFTRAGEDKEAVFSNLSIAVRGEAEKGWHDE